MKTCLLLLVLTISTFSQSIEDQIKSFQDSKRYTVIPDKFEKSTHIKYQQSLRATGQSFKGEVVVICFVEIYPKSPPIFGFYFGEQRFVYQRTSYLYKRDRLKLLLDGEPVEIGETKIDYTALIFLTADQIDAILAAKTVDMKIGPFETTLNTKTIQILKNLRSLKLN